MAEDARTRGRRSTISAQYAMQLLKSSPVMNLEKIPTEENAPAGAIAKVFDRLRKVLTIPTMGSYDSNCH